jgi:hypothetical protein
VAVILTLHWIGAALSAIPACGQTLYGEPVTLKGRHIYFTSWKYVRQGQFAWRIEKDPAMPADAQAVGAWLKGDGTRPAQFGPSDMPRGIRLVAQPATRVPFRPGQLAATLFENGKYKAWYSVSPCSEPEPFSTKDRILPGRSFDDADRLIGDGLALDVTWRNDPNPRHEGKPVILRFRMRQADLFGVEFY